MFAGRGHAVAKPMHGDAEAGERLFERHCVMCHSPIAGRKLVGPSLQALNDAAASAHSSARLRAVVANGKGTMPAFKSRVSPQEMDDLLAYLHQK